MKSRRSLLSLRLRDNGRARVSLSAESRGAVRELRRAVDRGDLTQRERARCPVCRSTGGWLVAEKDRLGIPCHTVVCSGCGLGINDSYFSGSDLQHFHEEYWSRLQGYTNRRSRFEDRTAPGSFSWCRFAFIQKRLDTTRALDRVAEIGTLDGSNLVPFQSVGADTVGCDLDSKGFEPARELGIELVRGSTRDLAEHLRDPVDLVILSHVLEHFEDPGEHLRQIRKILPAGGYLYVEVPGLRGRLRPETRARRDRPYESTSDVLMYLQAAHTFHFALAHVRALVEPLGFRLIDGDEWSRALFRRLARSDGAPEADVSLPSGEVVKEYLEATERSYLSVRNQTARVLRFAARKIE